MAEFQYRLKLAMRGGMILCTLGLTRESLDALHAVRAAATNPPRQLLDAAMDASPEAGGGPAAVVAAVHLVGSVVSTLVP